MRIVENSMRGVSSERKIEREKRERVKENAGGAGGVERDAGR
jgi:hypothetical protein